MSFILENVVATGILCFTCHGSVHSYCLGRKVKERRREERGAGEEGK